MNTGAKWRIAYVRCADDQWDHDGYCELIAQITFDLSPGLDLVHVTEHGGWARLFCRYDGHVISIGSSNDQAQYKGLHLKLREMYGAGDIDVVRVDEEFIQAAARDLRQVRLVSNLLSAGKPRMATV